ncbi:MAG: peptidoglycan recognition family protein [Acidobacteriota bacterium]
MPENFIQPSDAVEREAAKITDPLERLRYLRRQGPKPPAPAAGLPEMLPLEVTMPRQTFRWTTWAAAITVVTAGLGLWGYQMSANTPAKTAAKLPALTPPTGALPTGVWQVETSATEEVYSNGLRIDLSFATKNRPREEYGIFALDGGTEPVSKSRAPHGIVYHTTESDLAPFEEASSEKLATLGHLLLRFVRREHSYHYLIDRFGRVYRVVEESDAANHAGYSVWGDSRGVYVNLNDSFLGIAFEAKTDNAADVSAAQFTSARMLTEMLRSKYKIAREDCVTHAQVSVNPLNMRIGNHTDWAHGFPFAAMNLPDNYLTTLAAVTAFGFTHDEVLLKAEAGRDWPGLVVADKLVAKAAASEGSTEVRYRSMLQHRYKDIFAELKRQSEKGNEPHSQEGKQ